MTTRRQFMAGAAAGMAALGFGSSGKHEKDGESSVVLGIIVPGKSSVYVNQILLFQKTLDSMAFLDFLDHPLLSLNRDKIEVRLAEEVV